MGRRLLDKIRKATTYEEQKKNREELVTVLDDNSFSLTTKFCYNGSSTIIKAVLEEVPDGVEIIADQLDKVKHIDLSDPSQSVEVNIGDGRLYVPDRPFDQALVLSELLGVRARTKKGSSQDALTNLFMHPVMVTFILEKWRHVKFSFYLHLRFVESFFSRSHVHNVFFQGLDSFPPRLLPLPPDRHQPPPGEAEIPQRK